MKLKALLVAAVLAFTTPVVADNSIMFEVGWRFDNQVKSENLIDFGAIRVRHHEMEAHVATWDGTFAGGFGFVIDADDSTEGYVSFTPGVALTTDEHHGRLFYRGALGYSDGDFDYEVAHTAYMPIVGESDAFVTLAVAYDDGNNGGNHTPKSNRNDDDEDGNDDDDNGDECKPGYGNGDDNHCHDGPPGRQ